MPKAPIADSAATRLQSDTIGNKGDTAVQTSGSTASQTAYLKGILDILAGTAGVASFPSGAAPANAVSLAEVLRYIAESRNKSAQTALLANTPNGNTDLFTYNGPVKLLAIIGIVKTTAMAAAQTRIKLTATADALTAVDLCAALDVTGKAAGCTLNITGTVANAMVAADNGVAISQAGAITLPCVTSGKITLNNADTANAGRTQWYVLYEPLAPGAVVTAA